MNHSKLPKSQKVAKKLVDTIYLLQILDDILDGEGKTTTLLNIISGNIKYVFRKIEKYRKIL